MAKDDLPNCLGRLLMPCALCLIQSDATETEDVKRRKRSNPIEDQDTLGNPIWANDDGRVEISKELGQQSENGKWLVLLLAQEASRV